MSVVLSMQDVGPWRKQLTVEVPAPAVEAETQRVVREYGQRVRIPGFRRGKVPNELVRRRFAKDIEREVIDRLLPRYWRQAQAESQIDPLLPPEVDEVRDLEPGGPLTFVATVETRPQIELRNIRDFQLPDPEVEPGELDVDKALDDLRARFGEWVPVERPAARGDLVSAQLTATDAAPAPKASAAAPDTAAIAAPGTDAPAPAAPPTPESPEAAENTQRVEFEVGDERVWEEVSLAVSGLTAGQEAAFTREPAAGTPGDPGPDAGATGGPPRRFKVQVTAVKERELPPLDDELAARVNPQLGGLAELREMVARRLREAGVEARLQQRQRALLEQLRERHPLELPQGVVRREIEQIARAEAERLAQRGVRPDQAGLDWEAIREQIRPVAERRVHDELLLDAIAAAEPVVITDEEFERALATLARAQKTTTPALRKALDEHGRLTLLRDQIRRDKTILHLLGEMPLPATTAPGAPGAATAADADPFGTAAGAGAVDTPSGHPAAGNEAADAPE
ncbi:MAG TPA: trigger factor [Thermoanaerobaculia bacterium]|jgi:trigger factor|nr:trigger factor [Thermoanaerobaculia bacterium]